MAGEQTVQIVMRRVAEESQAEAARFLSGCFSLPLASARSIAASAPVALLSGLAPGQAEAVVAELRPSLPAGVALRVSAPGDDSGDASVSRLQWPRPPRVYGKDVEDFAASGESRDAACPICGGALRLTRDGDGLKVSAAPGPPERRHADETAVRPAPSPAPADGDADPLFSGIRPLATANENYASLRSLQAGDTGFWMDNKALFDAAPPPAREASPSPPAPGGTSHSRRVRASAGLAAFMKPGVFAIVVGRSRDPQVVKMIAEILGIPEPEARDRCLGLSLTLAHGIALDEAQSLLARLRNLGARARIVRPA